MQRACRKCRSRGTACSQTFLCPQRVARQPHEHHREIEQAPIRIRGRAESWLVPNGWETGSVSCRSGLANRIRARSVADVLAQTYNFAGLLASGLTMNQLTGATSSRSFGKNLASLTAPSSTTTSWEISTSPQRPGRTNCYPKSMETDREQHRETWKRQQVEGALQKE